MQVGNIGDEEDLSDDEGGVVTFLDPINKKINILNLNISWRKLSKLDLIACGTSFYACQTATYWFEKFSNLSAHAFLASEFRYKTYIKSNFCHLKIIDNGIGLPAEISNRLTEPYVTTREKGTGLGLAIVAKIVEDHGGTLRIRDISEREAGVVVTVTIPLVENQNSK